MNGGMGKDGTADQRRKERSEAFKNVQKERDIKESQGRWKGREDEERAGYVRNGMYDKKIGTKKEKKKEDGKKILQRHF